MKILLSLLTIFLLIFLSPSNSFCDQYVIYFIEGYYEKKDISPLDDKYCTLVNVYIAKPYYAGSGDEKITILHNDNSTTGAFELQQIGEGSSVRGSTLPNPYWYYKDKSGKSIFQDDKKWPIVAAGIYSFDVIDTTKWNGSYNRALKINKGYFVPTVNKNPNRSNERKANKIWIHRGRRNGPNRDSEGCLTIHPDDWDTFQSYFPSQHEWESTGLVLTSATNFKIPVQENATK